MDLYVKTLTGKTSILTVMLNQLIRDVKKMIEEKEGIKVERQLLVYAGRPLEDTRTLSDYNISKDSTCHLVDIQPILRRIKLQLCHQKRVHVMRSLPVSLESNNPFKIRIDDVDGFEFEPAFQLQRALLSSELVRKYSIDAVPGLLDIIDSYCNEQAVCFGDVISLSYNINPMDHAREEFRQKQVLKVDGVTEFRIMKGYCDTSYDGQPIRYGQDFVLQISEDCYLQRTESFPNKPAYLQSFNFHIDSQQIADSADSNVEYGQTWQIDMVDASVMGKIVRYGSATEAIALTIGGNFPIKTEDDYKNPNNDFRAYVTVRDPEGWTTMNFC